MNSNSFLKFSLKLTRMCINRQFQTSCVMQKISVGRYKVTKDKSNPLTYEQSVKPEWIGFRKGGHSHNTGQLEGTFLKKEEIGQDLPHKLLIEDLFIRKFIVGTFPNQLGSEVMIKRQHNIVRIAFILKRESRKTAPKTIYFLIGYSEELLSFWLKCPVRLELQSIESEMDMIYKYQ